jgi:hypothetical protein
VKEIGRESSFGLVESMPGDVQSTEAPTLRMALVTTRFSGISEKRELRLWIDS